MRVPKQAFILKVLLPQLLSLGDHALRIYLNRARFARSGDGTTYPSYQLLTAVLGNPTLCRRKCVQYVSPLSDELAVQQSCHCTAIEEFLQSSEDELLQRNLCKRTTRRNGSSTYPGMQLILPDGSNHTIPKNAPYGTFMIIPESIFTRGLTAIWPDEKRGLLPVSEHALKLLLVLLSESNNARYGGTNPNLLHRIMGEVVLGVPLSDWDRANLGEALRELEARRIILWSQAVISVHDDHLVRPDDVARFPDEKTAEILSIATDRSRA
jgi:hypothetical protein